MLYTRIEEAFDVLNARINGPTNAEIKKALTKINKSFVRLSGVLASKDVQDALGVIETYGQMGYLLSSDAATEIANSADTERLTTAPSQPAPTDVSEVVARQRQLSRKTPQAMQFAIQQIHWPIATWLEQSRQNRGGSSRDIERELIVLLVARDADAILSDATSTSIEAKLIDLCEYVFSRCGIDPAGTDEAVRRCLNRHEKFLSWYKLPTYSTPDRPFDIICVHAFSRFYRNGAEMELTIRQLRKHGVEVVSVTQPTGTDPSQELMRQIIGIFDEYTSRENGKNVIRAMRENAKQGFWNGATPPLGYRIYSAEVRGAKAKKALEVDPVDAETVRLIFKLYSEGDGARGPMGVKEVTKWLNANGYRSRKGSHFGVGAIHKILTNRCYMTGQWPYGRRSSRTGMLNDPASIVMIEVPPIVPMPLFENVQAKLARNNPKVTPPRVVNGPNLLTGIAVCASCGAGMTRTGTRRRGKDYTYYSCASCKLRGKTVCAGRHVPMAQLDSQVIEGLKGKLLTPKRMAKVLSALVERKAGKDTAVVERRQALDAELNQIRDKVTRLYQAIEDGIITPDADVKERITNLKARREVVEASLSRLAEQAINKSALTPEKIDAFTKLMSDKLDHGDAQARKAYLHAVISRIEVGDREVRIIGSKHLLAAAVVAGDLPPANVRGFVRKWRARVDSNHRPQD